MGKLKRSHNDPLTPPPQVGEHWVTRFLQRHPEYHIKKQKTLDVPRALAHQPQNILNWFERLQTSH